MESFHQFAEHGLKFPKRAYGGVWNGKLIWGQLTDSRVLSILKNPAYAGVYVFGRFRCVKHILQDGQIRQRVKQMPRDSWLVEIQNHHAGLSLLGGIPGESGSTRTQSHPPTGNRPQWSGPGRFSVAARTARSAGNVADA